MAFSGALRNTLSPAGFTRAISRPPLIRNLILDRTFTTVEYAKPLKYRRFPATMINLMDFRYNCLTLYNDVDDMLHPKHDKAKPDIEEADTNDPDWEGLCSAEDRNGANFCVEEQGAMLTALANSGTEYVCRIYKGDQRN